MTWEQVLGTDAATGEPLSARITARPWSLVLLLVGSILTLLDFWWVLNGAPAPRYKGQVLALLGESTWLAPSIAVLGPTCLVGGAYALAAYTPTALGRLADTVRILIVALMVLFPLAFLTRPPLARIDLGGQIFAVGGIRHYLHAPTMDLIFSDDLSTVKIHTGSCAQWNARLALTPLGDSMRLTGFQRIDNTVCTPSAGLLQVIHDLGTVRSWGVLNDDVNIIALHGDTHFRLY